MYLIWVYISIGNWPISYPYPGSDKTIFSGSLASTGSGGLANEGCGFEPAAW